MADDASMTTNQQFFMQHAGWSYDPSAETPDEGRARSALELAQAESWAAVAGVEFTWEDDWTCDHVAEFDCYDVEPTTCEGCIASVNGDHKASLWCIDDATPEYRRVIQAELAYEIKASAEELAASLSLASR